MSEQYLTIEHLSLKDITRIFNKVSIHPVTGCWEWQGARQKLHGYGFVKYRGKMEYIHRVMYAWLVGRLPRGHAQQLDHYKCDNPRCCNPSHLMLTTAVANTLRSNGITAANARKTGCIHGHEFTDKNTRWVRGQRACRECMRIEARERARKPEEKAKRRLRRRNRVTLREE